MSSQSNPQTYDRHGFQTLIVRFLSNHPCPLCGEVHELRIHAYLVRKVRDPESMENKEITIFSIYCGKAKTQGDQYTKRILPPFVISECSIMLCRVLVYLEQNPQQKINYAQAQMILGAKDSRTIRKHIVDGREIVERTILALTGVLSQEDQFSGVLEVKPETGVSERLRQTVAEVQTVGRRMHAETGEQTPAIAYVHLVYAVERARNPLKTPLDHVASDLVFHDTS